jgi:hypothetical protein
VVQFVSSFSKLEPSFASVSVGSNLRWQQLVHWRMFGVSQPCVSLLQQAPALRPADTRRRTARCMRHHPQAHLIRLRLRTIEKKVELLASGDATASFACQKNSQPAGQAGRLWMVSMRNAR